MKTVKMIILNWCLKHLFNALTYGQFLVVKIGKNMAGQKTGAIYVGKDKLPENEANLLGSEARSVLKMSVWRKLQESMRTEATEALVNKSKHLDDMVFAKAMLYTLDIQEKKLRDISLV